jgi:predicted AAA+ superfamily ATPase
MKQLIQELIEGKTNPKNIFFVQLDEPLFETEKNPLIHRLMNIYTKHILKKDEDSLPEKIYVFLDEKLNVVGTLRILRLMYDAKLIGKSEIMKALEKLRETGFRIVSLIF